MNDFKGTKGKWKLFGKKKSKIIIQNGVQIDIICKVDDDKLNCEHNYNALLISKAPEMLKFIYELVSDYENGLIEDLEIVTDRAKQLIKEATEI